MKILVNRIAPITAGILLALGSAASAQEFFREFGTSRSSGGIGRLAPGGETFTGNSPDGLSPVNPVDQSAVEDKYNFRLGLVDFVMAAGLGVEFNDNITLSSTDAISDMIIRPQFDIEGVLRISELNSLRFGLGIGYAKYIDHDEFDSDGPIISPNSALVWSIKAGDFVTITLRERLSYQEDPFDLPVLSGVATYKRWENQTGIQVDWDINEYTRVAVGYDRFDLWAKDDTFSSQDRGVDTVFIRPSVDISPNFTVGVNASASWITYKEDIQADSRVFMAGPYIQAKLNEVTDLYVEVGWQQSDFDGGTTQFFTPVGGGAPIAQLDTEDNSQLYFKTQLTHRPTEGFRHSLTASRTTETGLGSNFYDLWHFEYTADFLIRENTSISPVVFYEKYETSGQGGEDAHRFGLALGIHHVISSSFTIGLDYRFLTKDSNLPNSDYDQNLGMLSMYYKF